MRCIIAGGRNFTDYEHLERFMKSLPELPTTIISGCARGADTLAIQFAESYGLPCERYPANWAKYRNAAGPIRNIEMAENADMLVAFWNGFSKGTEHMIDAASKRDLIVFVEHYE